MAVSDAVFGLTVDTMYVNSPSHIGDPDGNHLLCNPGLERKSGFGELLFG